MTGNFSADLRFFSRATTGVGADSGARKVRTVCAAGSLSEHLGGGYDIGKYKFPESTAHRRPKGG